MMSSTSSCMDGYGNFMVHQQQVPPANFYNQGNNNSQRYQSGSYGGYSNDWAGAPLIKSGESRHKKLYSSRSNGYEYDESSMSRLAKHTHGAPIIMSSRYRSKSVKPMQPFGHENGNSRNYSANGFAKAPSSDEAHNYDDSGYHANGIQTCLPRIIKPRKRRKKDRKPIVGAAAASMENNPPTNPFTFASNQSSSAFMQNVHANNNSNAFHSNQMSDNFKRPAPPNESNLFFNCDFDPSSVLPLPSSTSSSPISLSNSSLSSSTNTSSCSCRLCDPNCKIWAFPLRRSFSDNSAELDHHGISDGAAHIETSRKDVGVIGGNRVKTGEWNSALGESTFSILDMIEFNHYQNEHKTLIADVNRMRSESASDSGDSGCDLLLGGLNISDEILASKLKTVGDRLASERLNSITQQLSEFSLMATHRHAPEVSAKDNEMSHLDANECAETMIRIDNLPPTFNTISKSLSSCEFGGEHRGSNLDSLLELTTSGINCNYGNLMSPMLVHKQNYSLDLNNNNHQVGALAPSVSNGLVLKERTLLFDCFDVAWQGS
jgi:hypothetical protein